MINLKRCAGRSWIDIYHKIQNDKEWKKANLKHEALLDLFTVCCVI